MVRVSNVMLDEVETTFVKPSCERSFTSLQDATSTKESSESGSIGSPSLAGTPAKTPRCDNSSTASGSMMSKAEEEDLMAKVEAAKRVQEFVPASKTIEKMKALNASVQGYHSSLFKTGEAMIQRQIELGILPRETDFSVASLSGSDCDRRQVAAVPRLVAPPGLSLESASATSSEAESRPQTAAERWLNMCK